MPPTHSCAHNALARLGLTTTQSTQLVFDELPSQQSPTFEESLPADHEPCKPVAISTNVLHSIAYYNIIETELSTLRASELTNPTTTSTHGRVTNAPTKTRSSCFHPQDTH
jgi:hypothetical protein